MPFYRMGEPGADDWFHVNLGSRPGPAKCVMPALAGDNLGIGRVCARMSEALCDAPGCDRPICEHHRTKDTSRKNTDYCPDHAHLAHPTLWGPTE